MSNHCVKSVPNGVFSGPNFPALGLNAGKYGPEKTPYLDTFHAVNILISVTPDYIILFVKDIANKLSYLMWNDWSKDVRIAAAKCLGKTGNGKVLNCNDNIILFITVMLPLIICYFY